jgi:hypothetical protein
MAAVVASLSLLLVVLVPSTAGAATLTTSRPYEAVCRQQGGTFAVAVDFASLYCDKPGGFFTAFTPAQLDRQRRLCERSYDGSFGVQGFMRDGITGTGTFCSTALPVRP